jgi:hypothetical protein
MSFNGATPELIMEWGRQLGANALSNRSFSTRGADMTDEVNPVLRVHVGVGAVVEKDLVRAAPTAAPALPADRRCAANIPQNLNDAWWHKCSLGQPDLGVPVLFVIDGTRHAGRRVGDAVAFWWEDTQAGQNAYKDADVTHWMPMLDLPA